MTFKQTQLSELELSALPTEADVRLYEERGWYISEQVLGDEVLDEALVGVERHHAGERDFDLPITEGFSDWKQSDSLSGVRNNEYTALQNRQIRNLVLQPIIGAIAARLTRSPVVRLFDDQILYKVPRQTSLSGIGWHVDGDYWQTCSSNNMLTAWIPLHDCPESMGPLVVIEGSHRWTDIPARKLFSFRSQDMDALKGLAPEPVNEVPMILTKGQLSFHHSRTVHGSYPNRGERARIAIAAHLQDASNRYRVVVDEKHTPVRLFNDRICRKDSSGLPDYTDPAVFPVIWDESW